MRRRSGRVAEGVFLAGMLLPAAAGSGPLHGQERLVLGGEGGAVFVPAGRVSLVGSEGSRVEVEVTFRGRDASRLRVERRPWEGRDAVVVRLPAGEDLVYPGFGGSTRLRIREDGTFGGAGGRGEDVRISGSGRGVEGWAEVVVRVPEGGQVEVRVGGGEIEARRVSGALVLSAQVGALTVSHLTGELSATTGSGSLTAEGLRGGPHRLTTGSGGVRLQDARSDELQVRTGSGSVRVDGAEGRAVVLRTGSGSLEVDGVSGDRLHLSTGSGAVSGRITRSPAELSVVTGSGGVTLTLPRGLGAEAEVRTGSGRIDVDFPATGVTTRRGYFRGVIGDGAGRISVRTGSGRVRIGGG